MTVVVYTMTWRQVKVDDKFAVLTETPIKEMQDELWKVEATARPDQKVRLILNLIEWNIPHNYIEIGKYVIFNIYCGTQKESSYIRNLLQVQGIKYFVSETKTL